MDSIPTTGYGEIIDIMEMLYSQEEVWELERHYIRQESMEIGIKRGMEKGLLLAIKALMESSGMTAEDAVSSLKITEADRPRYRELLRYPES